MTLCKRASSAPSMTLAAMPRRLVRLPPVGCWVLLTVILVAGTRGKVRRVAKSERHSVCLFAEQPMFHFHKLIAADFAASA